jgi:hypothetical protein
LGFLIWADQRLRDELAYCVPKALPHSRFLAWPDDDQDKALAYERAMRSVCARCGTRPAEWEADSFAYVGQSYACPGCEIRVQEQQNLPDGAAEYTAVYLAPKAVALPPEEA